MHHQQNSNTVQSFQFRDFEKVELLEKSYYRSKKIDFEMRESLHNRSELGCTRQLSTVSLHQLTHQDVNAPSIPSKWSHVESDCSYFVVQPTIQNRTKFQRYWMPKYISATISAECDNFHSWRVVRHVSMRIQSFVKGVAHNSNSPSVGHKGRSGQRTITFMSYYAFQMTDSKRLAR